MELSNQEKNMGLIFALGMRLNFDNDYGRTRRNQTELKKGVFIRRGKLIALVF